ncbi:MULTISPECIES: YciI family protein [Cyanophyceae]|uniref:YciI family protein n=1 Tax=Cyanophyceae TaxID=3028117 RepID=UPI001681F92E|nr:MULTISPECIES: YciI family protein [Cyanophyceae]MBD1918705.1 YciI family protein [Phormidium sp. FACHB-77]MBD2029088.1 YciI family protein [Phormidium sp. FACHB-322]MBD2051324.1 YciI family protein [Leptolyngbya sp. FACHB-60]
MAKFVMWGSYCENVLEKRTPFREAHLQGLQRQKDDGLLVALGPTTDNTKVFGIYEADSEATLRRLVEGDPYWQNGIWTEYEVYAWNQVF